MGAVNKTQLWLKYNSHLQLSFYILLVHLVPGKTLLCAVGLGQPGLNLDHKAVLRMEYVAIPRHGGLS